MNLIIQVKIECGENTCASAPGIFCKLFHPSIIKDGDCALFGPVFERDGWIMRHPVCKNNAVNDTTIRPNLAQCEVDRQHNICWRNNCYESDRCTAPEC